MKNVLVMPVGMTPQVVTETVYWYGVVATEKVCFDRICLMTTLPGAEQIRRYLMGEGSHLEKLCREYDLPALQLADEDVVVFGGDAPLEDIRSAADNDLMADEMTALVRRLAGDKTSRIYFSIAGGRKTMGTYLALMAHFFGREDRGDRLSHVLVSPDFERNLVDDEGIPFFYPPKTPRDFFPPHNPTQRINSRECRIDLAEIPIIFLSRFLTTNKLNRFTDVVEDIRRNLGREEEHPEVLIDVERQQIVINGQPTDDFRPKHFALYGAMLWCKKLGHAGESGEPGCMTPKEWFDDPEFVLAYLAIYQKFRPLADSVAKELQGLDFPNVDSGDANKDLQEFRTRFNEDLNLIGCPGIANLLVDNIGRRGEPLYRIALNPDRLSFNWPGAAPDYETTLSAELRPGSRAEERLQRLLQARAAQIR